jgi:hypothetical protein
MPRRDWILNLRPETDVGSGQVQTEVLHRPKCYNLTRPDPKFTFKHNRQPPASLYCRPKKNRSLYNPNNLTTLYEHLIIYNVQLKSEPRHTASLTAAALLTHRQSYCRVYGTLHHLSALFQSAVRIKHVTCKVGRDENPWENQAWLSFRTPSEPYIPRSSSDEFSIQHVSLSRSVHNARAASCASS